MNYAQGPPWGYGGVPCKINFFPYIWNEDSSRSYVGGGGGIDNKESILMKKEIFCLKQVFYKH